MKVETKLLTIFGGIFFEWKIFGKECLWKTFGGKLLVDKNRLIILLVEIVCGKYSVDFVFRKNYI